MDKYKVLDSRQIQRMTPAGGTVSVYRVWIETGRGSTGNIDVDMDDWTKEKLKPILEAFALELDLAFDLT